MRTLLSLAPEPNPSVTISTGDPGDALLVNVVDGGLGVADLVVNIVIALATVATLVWTVWTAVRALREANREKRLARQADRRRQGEHIAAWERIDVESVEDWDRDPPVRAINATRTISVVNSSSQPIYDVHIEFVDHSHQAGFNMLEYAVIPPTITPKVLSQDVAHRDDWRAGEHGLAITFRDAANNYWRRRADGTLEATHRNGKPLNEARSEDEAR